LTQFSQDILIPDDEQLFIGQHVILTLGRRMFFDNHEMLTGRGAKEAV